MAELDHGAKIALRADPRGVLGFVRPGAVFVKPLQKEAVSVQRTADATFEVVLDGERQLLHVELEAEPSSSSAKRAARAACTLHVATDLRVRVVVVYLHPAKDERRPPERWHLPVGEADLPFELRPVVLWECDPELALAGRAPGLMPFVSLMRDASFEQVRRAVETILASRLPEGDRADLVVAAHFLARHHFPKTKLAGIIPTEVLMQSPAYQEMAAEYEAKGRDEARKRRVQELKELVAARFGALPEDIDRGLASADEAALARATRAIALERDDAAAMAQVRAALVGGTRAGE